MSQDVFRQWTRQFSPTTRGSLYYLCAYAANAIYFPFISVYYADRGLSGSQIGLLAAIGPLVALIAGPLLAALADRRGWQVQMMVIGLAGVALTTLILPLAQPFALLLAVVLTMGLIGSPVGSISDGMIAQMAVKHRLNYGSMRLWGSASWVVMPLVGGVLWSIFGIWLMFPLAALLFVVSIFAARLLGDSKSSVVIERQPARLRSGAGRFWIVLLSALFISLGMIMARTFSTIYIDRLSGQTLVGLYAAVAAAIEIPVILWTEKIMRRIGGPFTLVLACLLLMSAFVGLAVIATPELLLLPALAEGIGFGLFITATIQLIAGWTPKGQMATYQGLLNAGSSGLAPLVAGLLGGAIFDAAGPQTVFVVSAGAVGVAIVVLVVAQLLGLFSKHAEHPSAPALDEELSRSI